MKRSMWLILFLLAGAAWALVPQKVTVNEFGKFNVGEMVTNLNAVIDQSSTNAAKLADAFNGSDAELGNVVVSNLTVTGNGNVITESDLATGSETNAANKVLKLDENGKINAEAIPFATIYFTGGRVTPTE